MVDINQGQTAQPQELKPQPQVQSQTGIPPQTPNKISSSKNLLKLLIGFFAIVFAVFILFVFVLPNLNKKEEKINLTFWGVYQEPQIFAPAISEFEKEHPNVNVLYQKQDIKDYMAKLTARTKEGNGPDIFMFHNTWVLSLSDILLPLPSDTVTSREFAKEFYPVEQKDLIKNGAIYGIPVNFDLLSLFVNQQILDNAGVSVPTNWTEFIDAARALTVKDSQGKIKTAGTAFGTYDNVAYAPDIFSLLLAQDGGNLNDLSSSKDKVSDALNFYTAFAKPSGNVWDGTQDKDLLAFSKGNLAMFFGYTRDEPLIKQGNPDLKFTVSPVPQLSFPGIEIASYFPVGISAKSKHQKEALLFLKFLKDKNIQNGTLRERAKLAVSSYFSGQTFDNSINSQLNSLLGGAISSILGGASSDSEAQKLSDGFSGVLSKYSK